MKTSAPRTVAGSKQGLLHRLGRIPRRWSWALLGLPLALGSPAGLLGMEALLHAGSPTIAWAIEELHRHALVYGYLIVATSAIFVLLGHGLGRLADRLEVSSRTDALTGLANLGGHRARFDEELSRVARHGSRLALLLLDVDRLKEINDQHGHETGDRVLVVVAQAMASACRAIDHAARIGGDEFAVLVNDASSEDARRLAERIEERTTALLADRIGPLVTASVSIGVAELGPAGPEDLRHAADKALYEAKAAGRARISVAPRPFLQAAS